MNQEVVNDINFDLPKNKSNVIKVIGVGGGGSNAINYMFKQGIIGVDFVVTNTDAQALAESSVPIKIQLGASLTEGLGAGANPEVGAKAAEESYDEIQSLLSTQTKMVFITAGMGGGTGTGAAPVIAKMAKDLDVLTVGIVTMPFQFEGKLRLDQAQKGLEIIKKSVDALIVINNNKLREVYGNLGFKAGFAKADEVLATAARGIAEVITHHYTQNIDLKDAKTVLTNSGTAIMGSGYSSGSNRAQEAISKALDSPLLNDNKITGCKNVLLLIVSGSDEITIDEIGEINDFIQTEAGNNTNIIMGVGEDESLGNEISVTVIATGFGIEQQNEISNTEAKKIIHTLEEDQKMEKDFSEKTFKINESENNNKVLDNQNLFQTKNFTKPSNDNELIELNYIISDIDVEFENISKTFNSLSMSDENLNSYNLNDKTEYNDKLNPDANIASSNLTLETNFNLTNLSENNEVVDDNAKIIEDDLQHLNRTNELDFDLINSTLNNKIENKDENDFIINEISSSELSEIEVFDHELLSEGELQTKFDFELPFEKKKISQEINFNKLEENKSIQAIEEPQLSELSEITFEPKDIKEDEESAEIVHGFESNIDLTVDEKLNDKNPFDNSIDQTFSSNTDKRREHLKKFNYKFKHQNSRIEDMENEPAYKRIGLDLNDEVSDVESRLSLDNDANDDLQLRSNNSFLHDNVD
jgi:cell division protein FtsZ